jgi:hypothetical protein
MDAEVSTHTFLTMIIEESVCFMSCEPIFLLQFLCCKHGIYLFINWTVRMSDNLPERVQIFGHAHIIVGNIFRLETCMNSLVPPYSKLNFQGKIFFTQNWCNITLTYRLFKDSFMPEPYLEILDAKKCHYFM